MKNLRAFVAICTLGTGLIACDESSRTITAAEGYRRDNGSSFGSGHRTDDSTTVSTTGTTTDTTTAASSLSGATAVGGLTISRNGSAFGSGH